MMLVVNVVEWQFLPRWQSFWHHKTWDEDYEGEMHWAGFAFWQFRWVLPFP